MASDLCMVKGGAVNHWLKHTQHAFLQVTAKLMLSIYLFRIHLVLISGFKRLLDHHMAMQQFHF